MKDGFVLFYLPFLLGFSSEMEDRMIDRYIEVLIGSTWEIEWQATNERTKEHGLEMCSWLRYGDEVI